MPAKALLPEVRNHPLSIAIVGASGDLSMRKIFPALFALYRQQLLPDRVRLAGYARSSYSNEEFRNTIRDHLLKKAPDDEADRTRQIHEFIQKIYYVQGQYDAAEDFKQLDAAMRGDLEDIRENRFFYMSIPPFLFAEVAHAMNDAGLVYQDADDEGDSWSRVVIEKPFGSDRTSSDELTRSMGQVFTEEQTFRIDHYLGKEVIQNLMVIRFANLILDPIWNRASIDHVKITWMEELGLEGRAGYFDKYGIIRDVMQNHLLQILALVAMEEPVRLGARHIRDEKVKVLRCIPPISLDDVIVGQYSGGERGGWKHPGYLEEKDVPEGSISPTYAAAVLHVKNRRWDGVPFLVRAGKGLNDTKTEIRIRFRDVPANVFAASAGELLPNELVIRVQPDAGIALHVMSKVPGLKIGLARRTLDLSYKSAFQAEIPDAYECLLLDVIQGEKGLFIRADELEAAWDIFTPVLHDLESCTIKPQPYPFGSHGPKSADALAALYGAEW
jgi:glucose-6-phosphate 1-dehydrogenase